MHHALVELMCDHGPWKHPNAGQSQFDITFNRDGTGKVGRSSVASSSHEQVTNLGLQETQLIAKREMGLGWLFEISLQWKFIPTLHRSPANVLDDECFKHLKHANISTKRPNFVGSGRLHVHMSPTQAKGWSRRLLSEAAYLPRDFTIVVEDCSRAGLST
jgi:hypothetical protein